MQEKKFRVEEFIALIIILNPFRSKEEVSDFLYLAVIGAAFLLKLWKEHARPKTVLLILAIITTTLQVLMDWPKLYFVTVCLCLLLFSFPLKVYLLPNLPSNVGYKKLQIPGKHLVKACLFYPSQPSKRQSVDWITDSLLQKFYKNKRSVLKIPVFLFRFILSYIKSYKLNPLSGNLSGAKGVIVFSHGYGATLHMYTHLLGRLAQDRIVVTMQHDQKPLSDTAAWGEQLQKRTQYVIQTLEYFRREADMKELLGPKFELSEYYLMGHSYGGATALNAAFEEAGANINGIIALDPWFQPVRNNRLSGGIPCSCIVLSFEKYWQQDFIKTYTKKVVQNNKEICTEYIIKDGHHLDITDVVYTLGKLPGLDQAENPERIVEVILEIVTTFMDNKGFRPDQRTLGDRVYQNHVYT